MPVWRNQEESLTAWFARIELPEEFHAGTDDNNVHMVDFTFSERRIEGTAPAEISKAHHVRGYLLQMMVMTDEPDAKRAHWYRAQRDPYREYQERPEPPPFNRRHVARVCPALDFGAAGGPPLKKNTHTNTQRHMLFWTLGTMPPGSRLCRSKELVLCV